MSAYTCETWFERDRAFVALVDADDGTTIFELWDDAVSEAIDDGFLRAPRHPRPSSADWLPCAVDYAIGMGYLPEAAR